MAIRIWYNSFYETRERDFQDFSQPVVTVGREATNDLVLDHHFISPRAATLEHNGQGWEITANSFDGVEVENRRLAQGEKVSLDARQIVRIFPYTLSIKTAGDDGDVVTKWDVLDGKLADFLRELHRQLLDLMGAAAVDPGALRDVQRMKHFERDVEGLAETLHLFDASLRDIMLHSAGHMVRNAVLQLATGPTQQTTSDSTIWTTSSEHIDLVSVIPERQAELQRIAATLMATLTAQHPDEPGESPRDALGLVEQHYWPTWDATVGSIRPELLRYLSLNNIKKEIKDTVFGYGPLEDLLRTSAVTEIMVVDSTKIYVERFGKLEKSGRRFVSDEVTESIIQRIVSKVGRRIDRSQPLVDARLADGSRVNAVIPPIAVHGPCLTIRKFAARKLSVDDLIRFDSLTQTVAQFLDASVRAGANILVSGGTGTGKTTLLNCLSDYIPNHERIVTIEDTAELKLKKDHVVSLETKEKNVEQTGEYTIRDLVRNALRMRPNRIIVGECRGPEALDMLQAMNTGHAGSMTTIHANTADDAISRLEVLVAQDKDTQLPVASIRQQIVGAIDLVVQLRREGTRRLVTQVSEVIEIDSVTGRIRTKDIFRAFQREDQVVLRPTGQLPTFMGTLIESGYLNLDTFY